MKKNEVIILALKLLGIFLSIQGLSAFTSTFGQNGFYGIGNWSLYLGFFIYLLAGLIILFKAKALSKFILPMNDSAITKLEISENFQAAALRIVGIYISVFAIPALLHLSGKAIEYEFFRNSYSDSINESPNFIVPLISQAIYFLCGLFLALGPGSIIKVLGRFDNTINKMNT